MSQKKGFWTESHSDSKKSYAGETEKHQLQSNNLALDLNEKQHIPHQKLV